MAKITAVRHDSRRKAFRVTAGRKSYWFPYAKLPQGAADGLVDKVEIDEELGREAFTYVLCSGREGTVHIEQVLDYNRDPRYLRDLLLYKLTLAACQRAAESGLSKRELIRRLGTSPAQLYRLLDATNYRKSLDQMLGLLSVLDCHVDLVVT